MGNFRLKEAIARSEMKGKKVLKQDISSRLWKDSSKAAQQVNMSSLLNGSQKKISPEWVPIICEMLNCSADFLFGLKDE